MKNERAIGEHTVLLGTWWQNLSTLWKEVLLINYHLETALDQDQKMQFIPGETPQTRYTRLIGHPISLSDWIVDDTLLLKIISLKKIDCFGVSFTSCAGLAPFTQLEEFYCGESLIEDLAVIQNSAGLKNLCLFGSPIENLNKANIPKSIKRLCIGGTKVTRLDALKECPDLQRLSIINSGVLSLSPLDNLTKLEMLKCFGGQLSGDEIDQFKKKHPTCLVINSESDPLSQIDIFAD